MNQSCVCTKIYLSLQSVTDNGYIHFAEQAVNLLILLYGLFYCPYFRIFGGCLYVDKIKALGVETISVTSVYGSRFFVAYNIS